MTSVRDLAATTATPHGTRGPLEVLAWRRVCGSSGGLVRVLMMANPRSKYVATHTPSLELL